MGREERARKRMATTATKGRSVIRKVSTEVSLRGLGGQHQRLVMRSDHHAPGGAPGKYRVIFTLARPGSLPVDEREFSFDPDVPGDSHLGISPPAIQGPNLTQDAT